MGIVVEVLVDEGDNVEEGQTLARLDAQALELGVEMAKARSWRQIETRWSLDVSRARFSVSCLRRMAASYFSSNIIMLLSSFRDTIS